MHRLKQVQQLAQAILSYQTELFVQLDEMVYPNTHQSETPKEQELNCPVKQTQVKPKKNIFDKIPDFQFEEGLQSKLYNLKLSHFTPRRRDELFKRFKRDQEDKILSNRREIQKIYYQREPINRSIKAQFTVHSRADQSKVQTFPINGEDLEKLKPESDLNDTIIGNYIKILRLCIIPPQVQQVTYFYSSFFFAKLLGDFLKDEYLFERDLSIQVISIKDKVKDNYRSVKRWNKKIDVFQKKILIFPINAFHHWFCVMVLNPGSLLNPDSEDNCQIIYCDSMFEKKEIVIEVIKIYLQCQLQQKKGMKIDIKDCNIPCYQLLIPRQTNNHDCGLYMLQYMQMLLCRKQQLSGLAEPQRRKKLELFPRTIIFSMRERLIRMFMNLISSQDQAEKIQYIDEYINETKHIFDRASKEDYDELNQHQYHKYQKMNKTISTGSNPEEKTLALMIKFYLDPQVNFYERDR